MFVRIIVQNNKVQFFDGTTSVQRTRLPDDDAVLVWSASTAQPFSAFQRIFALPIRMCPVPASYPQDLPESPSPLGRSTMHNQSERPHQATRQSVTKVGRDIDQCMYLLISRTNI
jgi:hypothetical protein